MNDPAYFKELMLRAPPVPDWFEPEIGPQPTPQNILVDRYEAGRGHITRTAEAHDTEYFHAVRKWEGLKKREQVFQWPSYYAREVIKAAGDAVEPPDPMLGTEVNKRIAAGTPAHGDSYWDGKDIKTWDGKNWIVR